MPSLFNGDQNKLWRSDSKQQNIKYEKKQEDTRRKFASLFNGDQKKNYFGEVIREGILIIAISK